MENTVNKTLALYVRENSQTAKVFEKYGLDFCCKGKRSLQEACTEKGLDSTAILNELNELTTTGTSGEYGFPYDKLRPTDLCDLIVSTHHQYVRTELPRIWGYAQKVASKHGDRYPYLHQLRTLVEELHAELIPHLVKEEKVLFPLIKQLDQAGDDESEMTVRARSFVSQPIAAMEHEHDHAGSLMAQIREVTNEYQPPVGACTTFKLLFDSLARFEKDLHQHVHLENNVLFPAF